MSLDQNLFTLLVTPHPDDANVIDLVDPAGRAHYRKQRIPGPVYKLEVYDPVAESLLVTVSAPSATSKHKTLELCNPTSVVELNYTGTIKFRWGFKWEDHEFEWKREECFMLRKPDPPVLVALTREPPGRLKTSTIQILDYNLNRFDIDDRKGLEIVMLTSLLTFQDSNETYHTPDANSPKPTTERKSSGPVLPPKPAQTGVERIAEIQRQRGEFNEICIEDEGRVEDYAQYCTNLLQDDALLFVTIKSAEAEHVSKVLKVVEQTKRLRHKAGEELELQQYVLYDTIPTKKGPRRIVLDDSGSKEKYIPPNSLTIHLSKIDMPELRPKAAPQPTNAKEKDKKWGKSPSSPAMHTNASLTSFGAPPPKVNRLSRPPGPSNEHIHSYQAHPKQPSPSPSQLNNPGIYIAPPIPKHSRAASSPNAPHNAYAGYAPSAPHSGYSMYAPEPGALNVPMPHASQSRPVTPTSVVSSMFGSLLKR